MYSRTHRQKRLKLNSYLLIVGHGLIFLKHGSEMISHLLAFFLVRYYLLNAIQQLNYNAVPNSLSRLSTTTLSSNQNPVL